MFIFLLWRSRASFFMSPVNHSIWSVFQLFLFKNYRNTWLLVGWVSFTLSFWLYCTCNLHYSFRSQRGVKILVRWGFPLQTTHMRSQHTVRCDGKRKDLRFVALAKPNFHNNFWSFDFILCVTISFVGQHCFSCWENWSDASLSNLKMNPFNSALNFNQTFAHFLLQKVYSVKWPFMTTLVINSYFFELDTL